MFYRIVKERRVLPSSVYPTVSNGSPTERNTEVCVEYRVSCIKQSRQRIRELLEESLRTEVRNILARITLASKIRLIIVR